MLCPSRSRIACLPPVTTRPWIGGLCRNRKRYQKECQYWLGLAFGAAHGDVLLVLMFQGLIECEVLLGCHLGDVALTTEARIPGSPPKNQCKK